MHDYQVKEVMTDKLAKLSQYWHKRSLVNWGVTQDLRMQFHVQIKYWGTHDAYLVFKDKVTKPEAEKVIDPIIAKIDQANQTKQSSNLNVDLDGVLRVLDFDRTQQANA